MGIAQPRVWDSFGNGFTTKELSKMTGLVANHISGIVKKGKYTTLKEVTADVESKRGNRREAIIIKDRDGVPYKIIDIVRMVEKSRSWVIKAFQSDTCNTVEDLLELEASRGVVTQDKHIKIDRGKLCYRNNFSVVCDHYTSCMDSRLTGFHHERYKPDGGCFTADYEDDLTGKKEGKQSDWEVRNIRCPPANRKKSQDFWVDIRREEDGDYGKQRDYNKENWYMDRVEAGVHSNV